MTYLTVFYRCTLFADDALIFRAIQSKEDKRHLQADLNHLLQWSLSNRVVFDPSKTKVMHITRSRNIHPPTHILGKSPLAASSSVQYLGITISSDLSWNSHVNAIVSRANRILGIVQLLEVHPPEHFLHCISRLSYLSSNMASLAGARTPRNNTD